MASERLTILAITALAAVVSIGPVAAHGRARHHRAHVEIDRPPTTPSADAVALGTLAPATRLGTLEQTYGDAAFARARAAARYEGEERRDAIEAATVGAPVPCDPRSAGPDSYPCRNDPRVRGYGQGYRFTPTGASAPQTFGADPAQQNEVLPPFTALFWAVNGMRFDPH